jgi:cytochrome P450
MMQLTLSIAGKTLFDAEVEQEAGEIGNAITTAMNLFMQRLTTPLAGLLDILPLPSNFRFFKAKHRLDATIYRLINERRASGEDRGDFLSMLLLAKLHAELENVLKGQLPTVADLPQLNYTRKVLAESMRLYPPAYVIGRRALGNFPIGQYVVPAGGIILMSPYVLHHDARYYPEPEKFDPERWNPEVEAQRPKFSYLPFGAGPRVCIGESFAWMEGILVLATLAQQWRMRLVPDHPIALQPMITLRPKHGMRMTLQLRKQLAGILA